MTVAGSGFDAGGNAYGAQYRCVFTLGCGGTSLAPDADSVQQGCHRMASTPAAAVSTTAVACRTPQWGAAHPYTGAGGGADGYFASISLYNTASRQLVAAASGSPAAAGAVGLGFREGWRGATPGIVAVSGGAVITIVGFGMDTACAASILGCYLCRFRSGGGTGAGAGGAPVPVYGGRVPCADRCGNSMRCISLCGCIADESFACGGYAARSSSLRCYRTCRRVADDSVSYTTVDDSRIEEFLYSTIPLFRGINMAKDFFTHGVVCVQSWLALGSD